MSGTPLVTRKSRGIFWLALIAVCMMNAQFTLTGKAYAGDNTVDVLVGGYADYDACGAVIAVSGLKAGGDGFLALRNGPGSKYVLMDKLPNGTQMWLCEERGSWFGVVLMSPGMNCGVGSPIARRQPYNGRCLSGWVYKKYTRPLAG